MKKNFRKVIFFDLYQTLLDVQLSTENLGKEIQGWDVFAKFTHQYKKEISGSEIQKLYNKRRDEFYSGKDKKVYHHNLLELMTDVLKQDVGFQLTEEDVTLLVYIYRKASRGYLRLYPGVFDALSHLSKEYTLSTASHTQGSFSQLELRELNIEQFFSHFIYTSDVGLRKESVEFYERALEIVGKKPEDCLVVGDNYDVDVLVPQKLGIAAIWVKNPITSDRYDQLVRKHTPKYSINIEDIGKLPDLITNMMA